MGWGNGIGIGWPNATSGGSGPIPTEEKYLISDCVYGGDYESIYYPIGTFVVNDRVTYELGTTSFGRIQSITTDINTGIEIFATGGNSTQCFDNTVQFISSNYATENDVVFRIDILPVDADFVSGGSEYAININYLTYGTAVVDMGGGEVDELPFYITGTTNLNDYIFSQGVQWQIFEASENLGHPTLLIYTEFMGQDFEFGNTSSFSNNDGCDFHYFLRGGSAQTGSTFQAGFRNDNC